MTKQQRKWLLIAVALLVFGAIKFGLIYWYLRHKPKAPAAQTLSCDIVKTACVLPGGGRLSFVSAPAHGQPFEVRLNGVEALEAPTADFSMPDMDMGFNRYTFIKDGDGWKAKVTLPMCVSGSRAWRLELKSGAGHYQVPFSVVR
ncbi:hypothetical protein [Chromobacterium sp. IIBBL 290-4]|uniref:hypothetical protein n=1 Tax=Chromobacterium sp. IIBBL 290-4 TaxID=2953890 RepID=UPI0020B713E6|nr:hypothetical protein [Chromobacterium sp. IIBBL 290-4]UTH72485.1 hypothetical protein NKT35_13085 [Chromobacterium sp. IIBBL 290-4]